MLPAPRHSEARLHPEHPPRLGLSTFLFVAPFYPLIVIVLDFEQVQAYQLGQYLRNLYLNPDSASHIRGIHSDLVDLQEVAVRVKVGGEGASVFDSATALLQGLFPPNPNNRITLANETTVVAPLNGYQYIPVETVEPSNDRSLEPWTDCPVCDGVS